MDATGNQYHWDARGRLTSISQNGTTVASYTYASNGIRTSATEGGVTTNFTLDGTRCVNEAAGGVNTASMFGPTGVICRGTQWFTPTAQGSIGSVTDGLGNAVAQNRYGVFGQVVTTNPNSGNPLQFLGGMSDPTTGLDYMGHSFYSPGLGLNVSGGGSFTDQSFGSSVGGFLGGFFHCVGGVLDNLGQTFWDVVLPGAGGDEPAPPARSEPSLLEWATGILQQFGDYSSPRAAGNTLCHLALLTTVPETGGEGGIPPVDVPPVEVPPVETPPAVPAPSGDIMTLFRVTEPDEANSLLNSGTWTGSPSGSESKFFWGSLEDAQTYGAMIQGKPGFDPAAIFSTSIDSAYVNGPVIMDGLPGYTVPNQYLGMLSPPELVAAP